MSLRSSLARGLAIAAATGVLLTGVAAVPAAADDGAGDDGSGLNLQSDGGQDAGLAGLDGLTGTGGLDGFGNGGSAGPYRGVVTARGGLWLLDRPDRGSRRVRFVPEGDPVSIFCRTTGDFVLGTPVWYLLTDGTWAWGTARYIRNVGPTPRWC
ncbi:SH3 domain-containing protein [Streptomyces sp. IBSBF 2390]|uniref:SH3 domain-containing protein n=1 Tax=Streptomyces sp. IBSBF 2390 TaxID=2903533 RepID=UPI002FDBC24F